MPNMFNSQEKICKPLQLAEVYSSTKKFKMVSMEVCPENI